MKRWRVMKKGEGYGGNRPWWPHICGSLGYSGNGRAMSYVDVVIFKRIYYRLFEIDCPPYEFAIHSPDMHRIGNEMRAANPCP